MDRRTFLKVSAMTAATAAAQRNAGAADTAIQLQPEPLGGPRAFIGAPPVIPHPTAMRTECLACHGQFGFPAIRTPHPERTNCRQCHVPIATIDRKP